MPDRCPWYCRMTLLVSKSQHLTICATRNTQQGGESASTSPCRGSLKRSQRRSWVGRGRQRARTLSSPAENRYGCLGETANPLTVLICPVSETFSSPLARSQILMTLSPAPVANHWLPGSTATERIQPR